MALRNGIIKINGQLGDLVFYKCGSKDVVRQKLLTNSKPEPVRKAVPILVQPVKMRLISEKYFASLVKLYA